MFNSDFYPTPDHVISQMLEGIDLTNKICLEPSAGKGNIVDYLNRHGAKTVIACESNKDLQKIVSSKCKLIAEDFLTVTSDQISHINLIVMNPPFSAEEKHILHAYNIAPDGCTILSLCNYEVYNNSYSLRRGELKNIIKTYGHIENLGPAFDEAERRTGVTIGLIKINKPGGSYNQEFEGFFMEDEPELQSNGIMPYNFARDIVNRYVAAVKLFDSQIELGAQMSELVGGFFSSELSFTCEREGASVLRSDFKKDLQKNAWKWVFEKMKLDKYTTKGLRDDINKFVEQQQSIPFTMRNIYKMIEIVIGTTSGRMDRAIIEVFDKLTQHHHDNRYNVEGWKTNSHYLIGQKFILPYMTEVKHNGGFGLTHRDHYTSLVEDMVKALCYITGENYDNHESLYCFLNKRIGGDSYRSEYFKYEWNTWYDWGFFQIKGFKKGTIHFKFKDLNVWAKFNQHVARIKGYPLPESIKRAT